MACAVNFAAQITEKEFCRDHIIGINKVVLAAQRHSSRGIIQRKLEKASFRLVVYTDAAFANNKDLKSQLGYLILLTGKYNRCNILQYSSYKSRRVARSVLGSEVYAFEDEFDFAFSLNHDLEKVTGLHIPIQMLTDSKSLFDIIPKSSTTKEKRLLIDIATIKHAYKNYELSEVGHILSQQNPSDAFTNMFLTSATHFYP